ncbi:plasminogen-like isoform X1 [Glandiceps talaboti]
MWAVIIVTLQVVAFSHQQPSSEYARCGDDQNYCYQSDVCAYVFTLPSNADETCQTIQETITDLEDMDDNFELIDDRIDTLGKNIDNQRREFDNWRNLIGEQYQRQEREISSLQGNVEAHKENVYHSLKDFRNETDTMEEVITKQQQTIAVLDMKFEQLMNMELPAPTCVTRWAKLSSGTDNAYSRVRCEHKEVMTGCSSYMPGKAHGTRNGEFIEIGDDGKATCIAQNGVTGRDYVECYNDDDQYDYRGTVHRTVTGKTCQRWDSQSPHEHEYTPAAYAGDGIGNHNYCRNPGGDHDRTWCYTTNANTRWENCEISVPRQGCDYMECYNDDDQYDYRGRVHRTVTGKTCQRWDSQSPHEHEYTPAAYAADGIGNHNYCRNPGRDHDRTWCYTTNANTRWENCEITAPSRGCDYMECYNDDDQYDYRGRVHRTVTGKTCQRWDSQSPHEHNYTPVVYAGDGVGNHNYCRNPGRDHDRTWCYTTDDNSRWENCDVSAPGQGCGVQAIARCCNWPQMNCTYVHAETLSGTSSGAESNKACMDKIAGMDAYLTGCMALTTLGELNGAKPTAISQQCQAVNGNGGKGVQAYAACCASPNLECTVKQSPRSGGQTGAMAVVSCDRGWTMTGCNVYTPYKVTDGAYIEENKCKAVNGGNGHYVYAEAVCCKENIT